MEALDDLETLLGEVEQDRLPNELLDLQRSLEDTLGELNKEMEKIIKERTDKLLVSSQTKKPTHMLLLLI